MRLTYNRLLSDEFFKVILFIGLMGMPLIAFADTRVYKGTPMPEEPTKWRESWPSDDEIRQMNVFELTYIPDKRREPLVRELMDGLEWVDKHLLGGGKETYPNKPWCDDVLESLKKWQNVTFIEPIFVANRFDDPKFADWHKRCPKWNDGDSDYYRTHNFRVYSNEEQEDVFLVEAYGVSRFDQIDRYGNIKRYHEDETGRLFFVYESMGGYTYFDLKQCSVSFGGGSGYSDWYQSLNSSALREVNAFLNVEGRKIAFRVSRYSKTSYSKGSLYVTEHRAGEPKLQYSCRYNALPIK